MQTLELEFQKNPQLRKQFEAERTKFNDALKQGSLRTLQQMQNLGGNRTFYTIPVVFHVVLGNQSLVTDAQLQAQLDTLNKDYAGLNGDTVKVPSWFKPFFGQSSIQFCLAKQTPSGDITNGIDRVSTVQTSFSNTDNGVKHTSTGGADAWDPSSYLNVWICPLSNGLLGYATFPNSGTANEQGVVIEYRSLPAGGSYANYNGGKTLTHEIGHYFNLYHIWGDDNGACTGTDFVDDTPNQANSSSTCQSGIVTDNCTPTGNGIMYQDYMDYTFDPCLVMFTVQQVQRMESALTAYRPSLLASIGCQSPVTYTLDAQLRSIDQPGQRVCANPFTPTITIRNRGQQTLSSIVVTAVLENGTTTKYTWTGSLAPQATASVNLPAITITPGKHILKIYLSNPNNGTDQNTTNDSTSISFQYYEAVAAVSESFENASFPPAGWDIVNPDGGITWERNTVAAKTGVASTRIDNHDYSAVGQQDYLRLPDLNLNAVDSAFITFQVAAAAYTDINTANNSWDTLEVVASRDCGQTYTSLYKKWAGSLVTHTTPVTTAFVPTAGEWRKDSINISSFINGGKFLLAFRNTTGFENYVYLDDVNVRTVTVNPNLKSQGFLVTPNPSSGLVTVQFYPQPTDIRSIQIFNLAGQKVAETIANGQSNNYVLDISRYSAGMYIVRVVKGNDVLIRKIILQH